MSEELKNIKKELKELCEKVKLLEDKIYHLGDLSEKEYLLSEGFYKPLKVGVFTKTVWYLESGDFSELHGWYSDEQISQSLGPPAFKEGDEVVLIKLPEDGDLYWFKRRVDGDYFGIEDGEIGLLESETGLHNFIEIILIFF